MYIFLVWRTWILHLIFWNSSNKNLGYFLKCLKSGFFKRNLSGPIKVHTLIKKLTMFTFIYDIIVLDFDK